MIPACNQTRLAGKSLIEFDAFPSELKLHWSMAGPSGFGDFPTIDTGEYIPPKIAVHFPLTEE